MSLKGIYLGMREDGKPHLYNGDRHIVMAGPNGSGKSTRFLVQNLMYAYGRSALVIDPKGELCAMTARFRAKHGRVVILNPFGLHHDLFDGYGLEQTGFNPLAHFDDTSDTFPDDIATLSEAIIKMEGKEPHWTASAQDLIASLIMHLCYRPAEKMNLPVEASIADVRRLLTEPSKFDKKGAPTKGLAATAQRMASSEYEPLKAKGARFTKESREIDSIISTAMTQTRAFDSPGLAANLKINGIDFADLKRRTVTVYVIIPANRLRTHSAWLRLILESALRAMYQTPNGDQRVMFMLDEAPMLGHMSALEDAAGIARGYQAQMIVCLQDLNQLHAIYETRWPSFLANAGALLAYAPRDYFTAKQLSDLSGQRTELVKSMNSGTSRQVGGPRTSTSESDGFGINPVPMPLWRPDELMGMGRGTGFLFAEDRTRAQLIKCPDYFDMPDLKPHVDPNPYYRL